MEEMEKKEVRFINCNDEQMFLVEDGGYVALKYPDSNYVLTRKCEYIDECHVKIGIYIYHILEFARIMQRQQAICLPATEEQIQKIQQCKKETSGKYKKDLSEKIKSVKVGER